MLLRVRHVPETSHNYQIYLVAVRKHRRLTATTSLVREAAEGESSGIFF